MAKFYTSDWHIHSEHSCDQACMPMATLPEAAKAQGIDQYGVTDHLHTRVNVPDIEASYASYQAVRVSGFHFGIELSVMSKWLIDRLHSGAERTPRGQIYGMPGSSPDRNVPVLGIEEHEIRALHAVYVIGGAHWPLDLADDDPRMVSHYLTQQLMLIEHPSVDILAHPWWWDMRRKAVQWGEDFRKIPHSANDELIAAAIAHDTCIEASISILASSSYNDQWKRAYADFLLEAYERGAKLTIGTDCHAGEYENLQAIALKYLGTVGFVSEDFVIPKMRDSSILSAWRH